MTNNLKLVHHIGLTKEECVDLVAWGIMHKLISYKQVTEEERRFINTKLNLRLKKPSPSCGSVSEQHEKPSAPGCHAAKPAEHSLSHERLPDQTEPPSASE